VFCVRILNELHARDVSDDCERCWLLVLVIAQNNHSKKNHLEPLGSIKPLVLKKPWSKAWRHLHHANATSPRAAHCIASRASQRIASHPVHRSAPRECNQPARSALHRKQSAHRVAQRTDPHVASRNNLACLIESSTHLFQNDILYIYYFKIKYLKFKI
jgi:hypothetical protein